MEPTFNAVLTRIGWRVHLEAHHQYGKGKPIPLQPLNFKSPQEYRRYRAWRTKMLRRTLACPKCKCKEWHYVRTEVMCAGRESSLYSEVR
jgi:hypothetical protein